MTNAELRFDPVGDVSVFDYEHDPAAYIPLAVFDKACQLLVGRAADRTLRAMLEKKNGIRIGFIYKLFEITLFP